MRSDTRWKEPRSPAWRTRPGRVVVAGAALLLAVVLGGVWATPRAIVALKAGRERDAIAWEDFRDEIRREIAEAEALAGKASAFEAGEALRRARVEGRNGFSHRFMDHAGNATATRAGSAAMEGEAEISGAPADEVADVAQGNETRDAGVQMQEPILGDDRRPAFVLASGTGLRFPVRLPAEPLELMLGLGAEGGGPRGSLEIELRFAGRRETLARMAAPQGEAWAHQRVPLPRWAAGEGSVEFRHADGNGAGVAGSPGLATPAPLFVAEPLVFGRPELRLNVILVLEDTLRSDHLSGYGYHRRTSPEKDAFFAGGVTFEHPFSQAPSTLISITSMMTSLYPSATGVLKHGDRLSGQVLTLAEILRDQGYATASIIQNPYAGPLSGLDQGFERIHTTARGRGWPTSREVYEEKALEWLDDFEGRNAFLYLHLLDPHHPYFRVPPVFLHGGAQLKEPRAGDDPLALRGDPDTPGLTIHERHRFEYGGEIRANDHSFGRFLEELKRRGLLETTLIIFLSDHGEYFGEENRRVHTPPGFTHVLHVPLMMHHPRLLPVGARIAEPVQLVDVVPTILELLEIPREPFLLAGDSLVPLIRGEAGAAERWARRVIVSQEGAAGGASFVRGPWHVLSSPSFMSNYEKFETFSGLRMAWWRWQLSGEQVRVFNYVEDRQERRGLGALARDEAFREELIALRQSLLDRHGAVHALLGGEGEAEPEIDPGTIDVLKRLGYL